MFGSGQPRCHIDFGLGTFETKAEHRIDKVLFHVVNLTGLVLSVYGQFNQRFLYDGESL